MDKLKHVAFICDGNGRWASKQNKPRTFGHARGAEVVKEITMALKHRHDVSAATFYIFSTENWKRPKAEVAFIINAIDGYLAKWMNVFNEERVRVRFIGNRNGLAKSIIKTFDKYEGLTKHHTEFDLNIAFNYGSRDELVQVVKGIVDDKISSDDINEELINSRLYTSYLPEVDLLVRTSNELRISNFLLWQIAYSELYFTEVLWPDFSIDELDKAIESYYRRDRRYGGLVDEDKSN